MTKLLVTFRSDEAPSLDGVKQRFALRDEDIDETFGVVEVDPERHIFTALVEPEAASRIAGQEPETGVHSNPEISTFDLPGE